jgi:hypothetical protein
VISFVVGRHGVGGEAMDPFYYETTASIAQIAFETSVGK